jgi:hypothetical protein
MKPSGGTPVKSLPRSLPPTATGARIVAHIIRDKSMAGLSRGRPASSTWFGITECDIDLADFAGS